jgi:hypothetical protein
MAYTKYSLTPASNNAAPPNGAPEGMLPSAVNDTMRDMMSQIRDVGDGIRDGTYTMTAAKITGGSITGITDLAVADGGTGASTLTANNVLLGNGTSAVQFVAPSTSGNVLTSNGTTWTSATPAAGGTVIPAGTVILFYQAAAPTGFTQVTTQNDKALRVVSGTGGGTGGSVAFTTAFASQSVNGTVGTSGATTLSTSQIPSHTHSTGNAVAGEGSAGFAGGEGGLITITGAAGGGGSHTHSGGTFTGTAINLAVQYIDIILCSKD